MSSLKKMSSIIFNSFENVQLYLLKPHKKIVLKSSDAINTIFFFCNKFDNF